MLLGLHRIASFRIDPIIIFFLEGGDAPNSPLDISSSCVERSLHVEFQLCKLLGSGSFMVGQIRGKYNSPDEGPGCNLFGLNILLTKNKQIDFHISYNNLFPFNMTVRAYYLFSCNFD